VQGNPGLEHCRLVVFPELGSMKIERPEKFGGDMEYGSYQELESAFGSGDVHPADLKSSVAKHISDILAPVREHLDKNPENQEKVMRIIGGK